MTTILCVTNLISIVICSLPEIADPAQSADGDSQNLIADALIETPRVLIIDDEIEISETIADLLLLKGYQVAITGNATDAIQELLRAEFDIILTDMMMPGGGAAAVLQACSELTKRPTIILMTGRSDASLNQEDFPHLPDALIHKPFRLEELLSVIHIYHK